MGLKIWSKAYGYVLPNNLIDIILDYCIDIENIKNTFSWVIFEMNTYSSINNYYKWLYIYNFIIKNTINTKNIFKYTLNIIKNVIPHCLSNIENPLLDNFDTKNILFRYLNKDKKIEKKLSKRIINQILDMIERKNYKNYNLYILASITFNCFNKFIKTKYINIKDFYKIFRSKNYMNKKIDINFFKDQNKWIYIEDKYLSQNYTSI